MAVLVSDSFNRADSTTTLGTTDSYAGGSAMAWAVVGTTAKYGISSNQAYQDTTANDSPAYVDMTTQADNVRISVDIYVSTGIFVNGLAFRVQNDGNYFRCTATTGAIKIEKIVGFGGATTIANTTLTGISVPFTISVELSGSTITYYVNGVQKGTVTDTALQTATKHGLYIGNGTSPRLDNFKIESLSTGGTDTTVTSIAATATNTAVAPSISGNATISSIAAASSMSGIAPSVSADANVTAITATASAGAISPSVTAERHAVIVSIAANITASAKAPYIGDISVIIGTIKLKGERTIKLSLKGERKLTFNLKGGL